MIITRYRPSTGSAAWLLHRATGIALSAYMLLHLWVLGHLGSREGFERLMLLRDSLAVRVLELFLLGAVAAHALNGIRIVSLELGAPTRMQGPLFRIVIAVWSALMIYASYVMLTGGAG